MAIGQRALAFFRARSFSASTFVVLGSQVLRSAFVLLTWAVIGRFLGAQALGRIQIAYLLPLSIAIFLNLGLPVANAYLIGKRQYPIENIFGNNLLLSVAGSSVAVVILLATKPAAIRYSSIPSELFIADVVWIPLQQLYSVLLSLLLGEQRFAEQSWIGVLNGICMALGTLLTAVVLKLGVPGVTWTLVGSTAIFVGYMCWLYWPAHISLLWPSKPLVTDSLRLGLKAYFGNMLQFFNYRFDSFIVAYFAGATALGVYAVAYSVAELLWYIPQAVATVLLPVTSSSEADVATLRTSRICRLSIGIGVMTGLAIALATPLLIPRFMGLEYRKSVSLIWILLPGAVLFVCAKILAADLSGRGRPEFGSYAALGGLLATIPLNLVFVPIYGASASAAISSVVYFAEAVYLLICYSRMTTVSVSSLLWPRRQDLVFPSWQWSSSLKAAASK